MNEAGDIGDLRRLATAQSRPELAGLDRLSAAALVALMTAEARRVPEAVAGVQDAIARAAEAIADRLEQGGRLIYAGAGTAGRLGLLDAAEAGPAVDAPDGQVVGVLAGGAGAFQVPAEGAEDDRAAGEEALRTLGVTARDAVVGIAASGRTPYVLGALAAARAAGALTIGLACNEQTPIGAAAEIAIEVPVGPELIAGSTRLNAGTAQKVVLNMLSTAAMVLLGKTYGDLIVEVRATDEKLRDRASRIVARIADVDGDEARVALEQAGWRPKTAAAMLAGGIDAGAAARVLERHRGRLRPALEELAGARGRVVRAERRLGVAAALVDGALVPGDVAIADGRIAAVGLAGGGHGLAIPALVDAQVNGYAGVDLVGADEAAIAAAGEALRRDGVGAYLPTLITGETGATLAALRRIAAVQAAAPPGAAILGVHLEGPFLSPARSGAHPPERLQAPSLTLLDELLDGGPVVLVTLAPELPGAGRLIARCRERGVAVSLGHSAADAHTARAAFDAGASAVTHLLNAMGGIDARAPGLAGTALAMPGVIVQLIADGVHVADDLIRLAFAAAPGRCALVSDAIAASGLGDGEHRLGEVAVSVRDGVARRADGTLAGSAARLRDGVARLARLGIDTVAAVEAATAVPARLLRDECHGRLVHGGPADVLVLGDGLELERVVVAGAELR